ncbi:MAG: hypothetical protein ACFFCV_21070 [Promethearchaeota archaeon]
MSPETLTQSISSQGNIPFKSKTFSHVRHLKCWDIIMSQIWVADSTVIAMGFTLAL